MPEALIIVVAVHTLLFVSHMLASYLSSQYLLHCVKSTMGEPGRRKSCSEDLHWRIVYQRHLMGLNYREISQNLTVSVLNTYSMNMQKFGKT